MKNKVLLSLIGALLAFSSFLMGKVGSTPAHPLGNTQFGTEAYATTTGTQTAWANYSVIQSPLSRNSMSPGGTRIATSAPTYVEGLTVTTTGTSPFCLYDSTSTVPNGEWATTTIACFPASPTVGWYPLNYRAQKGVLIEWTGSPTTATRASTTIQFQ